MKEINYLTIHKDTKYGGMDFGINGSVTELSIEDYNELKVMLITAIGTMEIMYRNANSPKASQTQPDIKQ